MDEELIAIGTVIAAISATPLFAWTTEQEKSLKLWGNTLQATGNGLTADDIDTSSIGQVASVLSSSGNITVIAGIFNENNRKIRTIQGNQLQALGASIALSEGVEKNELTLIIGNGLQAIGNALQAEGARLSKDDWTLLGSWIQAAGATLIAVEAYE
ncbi:hypothetical protein H0266_02555 [Halobacillus locisalis]|uniref:Uncharacterized protein n=1 Tax=Halobacillus locisalis TaxID=220753 RepID=A0A838CPA8_9BACI|nr:hypothetical protein [Halobacillus locisalis]MBA2173771.1 hypothetical protein [Halobacillus locisalis]